MNPLGKHSPTVWDVKFIVPMELKKINTYIPNNWISLLMEHAQSLQIQITLPIPDDKLWKMTVLLWTCS